MTNKSKQQVDVPTNFPEPATGLNEAQHETVSASEGDPASAARKPKLGTVTKTVKLPSGAVLTSYE